MALCFIGLGANLGDLAATLRAAIVAIGALPQTCLEAVSSAWRSAPVDAAGPDFLNAVVRVRTELPPDTLLKALQAIELTHGRERAYVNAPRTLDLDLLLYDELQMHSAQLTLPHPRLHQRAFVLHPLLEVAPDRADLAALLPELAEQRLVKTTEGLSP